MTYRWKIILFAHQSGKSPVVDFIYRAETRLQTKIRNSFQLLMEFGTRLGPPHTKKLKGNGLWELRILGAESCRILYSQIEAKTFIILNIFQKKQLKTPRNEVETAQKRLLLYLKMNS